MNINWPVWRERRREGWEGRRDGRGREGGMGRQEGWEGEGGRDELEGGMNRREGGREGEGEGHWERRSQKINKSFISILTYPSFVSSQTFQSITRKVECHIAHPCWLPLFLIHEIPVKTDLGQGACSCRALCIYVAGIVSTDLHKTFYISCVCPLNFLCIFKNTDQTIWLTPSQNFAGSSTQLSCSAFLQELPLSSDTTYLLESFLIGHNDIMTPHTTPSSITHALQKEEK